MGKTCRWLEFVSLFIIGFSLCLDNLYSLYSLYGLYGLYGLDSLDMGFPLDDLAGQSRQL
jgi:hypothetical protein